MHTLRTRTAVLVALIVSGLCGLGGCPGVPGVPSPLAGTWSGTLTYHFVTEYPGSSPITMDFTTSYSVTFDDDGYADILGVPTGGGFYPMGGLAEPGDFAQFSLDAEGYTITYTITVRDASHTPTSYNVTLDIDYSATGVVDYTMTGTETVRYSLLADGSLEVYFSMEITGNFEGETTTQSGTLTGTLTRQ